MKNQNQITTTDLADSSDSDEFKMRLNRAYFHCSGNMMNQVPTKQFGNLLRTASSKLSFVFLFLLPAIE
jgi:hypothetical protein